MVEAINAQYSSGSKRTSAPEEQQAVAQSRGMREGGSIKKYAKGGSVSSASKRADGIATKGKTRGKFV